MLKMIISFLLFVFLCSNVVWAKDFKFNKFKRGIINIVTSPVEIPREMRAYWIKGSEKTYHISAWLLCGAVKGIVMMPARAVSGIYDVVTFPVDYPRDNQPLLKPGYVFEDWPKRQEGVIYKNIGDE